MPKPKPRQTAKLEELAEPRFGTLSDAEKELLRAAPKGEIAYCGPNDRDDDPENDPRKTGTWGPKRAIRAEIIGWLCAYREAKEYVHPRGIRAHAAEITGKLDLSLVSVSFSLSLLCCKFSDDLDLGLIETPAIDLTASCLPCLTADYASVKGNISLVNVQAKGMVRLRGAQIGGNLDCSGGQFHNPAQAGVRGSGVALDAVGAKVTGAVLLRNGFAAQGQVLLYASEIGGNLDCRGGQFQYPAQAGVDGSGMALNAEGAKVSGYVSLSRWLSPGGSQPFVAKGQVRLFGAQVGRNLDCEGAQLQNPAQIDVKESGMALMAESAKIAGSVLLRKKCAAEGQVRLYGAEIGGNLDCEDGQFSNPLDPTIETSGMALHVEAAKVTGAILLRFGFTAEGQVRIYGCEIGGNLECDDGKFKNPALPDIKESGIALLAEGVKVTGSVLLRRGFAAEGQVRLFGCEIGRNLDCEDGKFQNPVVPKAELSGMALQAEGAKVAGSALLRKKFLAVGEVRMYRARIEGDLDFKEGEFGSLNLTSASAGAIQDDEKGWPQKGKLLLDGFSYSRISGGPTSARKRLQWLERETPFARQPYRQLAKVLREAGDDHGSRKVSSVMERRTWEGRSLLLRPVSLMLRITIGYGYFSLRAIWCLLALVVLGVFVYERGYWVSSMVPTEKTAYDAFLARKPLPGNYESFHALPYSLENSFPLVKLGLQDKWAPKQDEQAGDSALHQPSPKFLRWFRWGQICAGWLLATLFVGGVTGLIRKE